MSLKRLEQLYQSCREGEKYISDGSTYYYDGYHDGYRKYPRSSVLENDFRYGDAYKMGYLDGIGDRVTDEIDGDSDL